MPSADLHCISSRRGFTLLELIVVLAVLSISLAVVIPNVSGAIDSVRTRAAARELIAALRNVRTLALTQQRELTLQLDVKQKVYTIGDDTQAKRLPDMLDITLTAARSEQTSTDEAAIRFYPDGSSSGGRITLAREPNFFAIDVDWITGYAHIRQ